VPRVTIRRNRSRRRHTRGRRPDAQALAQLDAAVSKLKRKHRETLTKVASRIATHTKRRGLSLSPGATEVLLIPFAEILELEDRMLNLEQTQETLDKVISEMAWHPDPRDVERQRSSLSVIRALWKRWCDIPPICGPTQTGSR
jgi:hypothetical protein